MPTASPAELDHRHIPLVLIDVSTTNPRRKFNQEKLDELRDSILRVGVVQPIVLRPKGLRFELVAGERRWRASRAAQLETIPAIVRELDDKDAFNIQLTENGQREDLHPLEEAEGYETAIRRFGYDVDALALKIGKSRSYVYGRMKLAELTDKAKDSLWKDEISHSVALLLARVPRELQDEALEEILGGQYGEPMSFRETRDFLEEEFFRRLANVPWHLDDAGLVPAAGPCSTCPFRSGNQKELFGEVARDADVCTKPECFQSKINAHLQIKRTEAEAKGLTVLSAEESKKLIQHGHVDRNSGYVQMDDKVLANDKHQPYSKLVGKAVKPVIAFDEQRGKVLELLPLKDVREFAKEKGIVLDRFSSSGRGSVNADKKFREERQRERLVEAAVLDELRAAVEKVKFKHDTLTLNLLRVFCLAIAHSKSYAVDKILARHGEKAVTYQNRAKLTNKLVTDTPDSGLVVMIAEMLFTFGAFEQRTNAERDLAKEFCKLLDVDRGAIAKRIATEQSAKKREKAEKGKKAASKKAEAASQSTSKKKQTATAAGKTKAGTCRKCKCTDEKACPEGCSWVDASQTLCSSCDVCGCGARFKNAVEREFGKCGKCQKAETDALREQHGTSKRRSA